MAKQTAHIEDWEIIPHPIGGADCLCGIVSQHPEPMANSWTAADRSTTSPLVRISKEAGIAETRNTFYTLGAPRSVT